MALLLDFLLSWVLLEQPLVLIIFILPKLSITGKWMISRYSGIGKMWDQTHEFPMLWVITHSSVRRLLKIWFRFIWRLWVTDTLCPLWFAINTSTRGKAMKSNSPSLSVLVRNTRKTHDDHQAVTRTFLVLFYTWFHPCREVEGVSTNTNHWGFLNTCLFILFYFQRYINR